MINESKKINVVRVEESILTLKKYVKESEIVDLLAALEALKRDPNVESNSERFLGAFNNLGITQGAVLTYAPYMSILLSDDFFGYK